MILSNGYAGAGAIGAWPRGADREARAVGRLFERIGGVMVLWLHRGRSRCALLALDDHALRDIGVSRADAVREGRKPFWR
jgi:uncharacterized protein YjiS (DUF1127 family)